jgi:uncharacterized surface protein with fasciclin (FAS1) repeats
MIFKTLVLAGAIALGLGAVPAMVAGAPKDIVDTAVAAGQFKTLAAALNAAGLVETLKGPGPYTVFAPTDAAFAKLPPGTVQQLLKPENKAKLTAILTYHMVPGRLSSGELAKMKDVKTVEGRSLAVRSMGKAVMVDGAKVTAADIQAGNGVIHVIDTVLMPPNS